MIAFLGTACEPAVVPGQARVVPMMACPGEPGLKVIGSSDEVHVVDALAMSGDEGRCSVRKATGSPQTGFDPWMSEWGNPARKGHPALNT